MRGNRDKMDKSDVLEYRVRGGIAEITFQYGFELRLVPYRNWGNIEGFDSAILYHKGSLEALATERPSRYSRPEESGFWSKGKITQQELAKYWNAAVQIAKQVYDDYSAGKIDEDAWMRQFWSFWIIATSGWITRTALEEGRERVFDKKPERISDKI